MKQEKKDFLTLATPPARLNITETAWFSASLSTIFQS